ncbi:hypothetical protein K2224_07835 [Streptomyces sp. BHT-5-2]|uniref:hypothetical protein n=1 Tax=Streptomyces sp. BHT-5-2 TaxID=2866715 RepID=UPI001C8E394D|nr:hypothetical protein [Streptomyces sp. BHT-5-2]QZL03130.1 hypothetical protein K2224_07835 [Streptomyces sp. BHT-5-2]
MAGTFTTRTIDITTGSTETLHDLTNACSAFLREAAQSVVLVNADRDNPERQVRLSFLS